MEKNKITFESIIEQENNDLNKNVSSDMPIKKNYWEHENFHNIFYTRTKRFSKDENELKKEYDTWHKEMGRAYYSPELHKFTIDDLTTKHKLKSSNDLIKYLNYHPLLTLKDKKNISLIKKEIEDKYFRNSFINTCLGLFVIISICRKQASKEKTNLAQVIKKHYFLAISSLFMSFVIIDFGFRYKKYKLLINSLYDKKMVDRYFDKYL
jgi:hypothetical protein